MIKSVYFLKKDKNQGVKNNVVYNKNSIVEYYKHF